MKRIRTLIGATVLTVILASPTLAAKPASAFVVGPDDAHFGETVGLVDFSFGSKVKTDSRNFWARVDCSVNETSVTTDLTSGGRLYAEYLHLGPQEGDPINDNLMTFGPTPSWSGGGADCEVNLLVYDGNGNFNRVQGGTDTFTVLP